VTLSAVDTEPACTEAPKDEVRAPLPEPVTVLSAAPAGLRIQSVDLTAISRETWDRLAAATPSATPFSSWAFHRAWWDAYGDNAHEQTLVAVRADALSGAAGADALSGAAGAELAADPAVLAADPVAIIPLMHRHEVEPEDAERHTSIRHGGGAPLTPVPPGAKAIFFGASYHADYATILAHPGDLPAVAAALVAHLVAATRPGAAELPWDAVDLRRLRCDDPAADALAAAFRRHEMAEGWTLNLEREDVCPVATLPHGGTIDDVLERLGKKERHEIRRKVRRAEAAGDVELAESTDPLADLEGFINLHQRRWGADGLFPDTAGGAQSRVLFRRLFELFGPDGALRLGFLTVGGRRVAAGIHFETADSILYYNAGVDPEARDLSPGVLLVERLVRRALERGKRRLDFLRGNEGYKYEWGGVDEPIQRLLIRREVG
jgi:CelD/BcsL family acetyltransferase involved in cellulose biosynthesis